MLTLCLLYELRIDVLKIRGVVVWAQGIAEVMAIDTADEVLVAIYARIKEELFKKRLFILLPYYLMRYEHMLASISGDEQKTARLVAECTELRMSLAEATIGKGDTLLYEELTELIIRVSDYLTQTYEVLQKKVRAAMGGEVLELLNDRAERLEREAETRGLANGLKQGLKQGLEQGLEQGTIDLAELLKERGVSEELVNKAVDALREKRKRESSIEEE